MKFNRMVHRKVLLIVRDGWGYTEKTKGNAIKAAHTPNDDYYMENYPWTLLKCTGKAVGLPPGTQGGSEPGHLTMGAGRIVWQPLEVINRSIQDQSFYRRKQFIDAIEHTKKTGGTLHLAGLHSDQGIHGTTKHLYALLETAKREQFNRVYIHCYLDGRDVPERSAIKFLEKTQKIIKQKETGKIASIIGRYYAMDRDKNWERTQQAYDLLTLGQGIKETDPIQAIKKYYNLNPDITDYYIKPITILDKNKKPMIINDSDAFIFWNYRSDRARQITYALTQNRFKEFQRQKKPHIHYVCMSVYDQGLDLPVAFPQNPVTNNLGNILSKAGLTQLRIAETEKYAHITFFFNSQIETPNLNETRLLIPSQKTPNYRDTPEMSAWEITSTLIQEMQLSGYNFILVNYANGDLVGHSANLEAAITACEIVDECIGRVIEYALTCNYTVLLTGDHGNLEAMFYPDGSPNPSHGLNPVPFVLISDEEELQKIQLKNNMGLSSVTPTILELMGLEKPEEMNARSLLGNSKILYGKND